MGFDQLVVFDLDGTLLNKYSKLSQFTIETLRKLDNRNIPYTIATGRSYQSAANLIKDHTFLFPHIYTNGVLTWCPNKNHFSLINIILKSDLYIAELILFITPTFFFRTSIFSCISLKEKNWSSSLKPR